MMNVTVEDNTNTTVPEAWIVAAQGWAWAVSCVGGIGNLVTISTIAHQLYLGRMWRRHYQCGHRAGRPVVALEGDTLLLLHLSFCDFLYCAVNLPITAITYNYAIGLSDTVPSKSFCTGAALFRYINALAEWTTLGLLTVQRCVDLGRSRGARFFRPRPTILFIVAIWLGSVLLQMDAIVQDQYNYDYTTYKCDMTDQKGRFYFYTLESLLPCCLMLTGCLSIIFQIWRNTRMLRAAGMPQELVRMRFRRMLKSAALLLALLLLFLVCIIPICVYNVITLITDKIHVPLGIAIFMSYWIQYGINFLVYAASNANYRKAYKQFFRLIAARTGKSFKALRCDSNRSPTILQLSSAIVQGGSIAAVPIHSSEVCSSGARLIKPRRLRTCYSQSHRPLFLKSSDTESGDVLPALSFHYISSSVSSNGTPSPRSSTLTMESVFMHDSVSTH